MDQSQILERIDDFLSRGMDILKKITACHPSNVTEGPSSPISFGYIRLEYIDWIKSWKQFIREQIPSIYGRALLDLTLNELPGTEDLKDRILNLTDNMKKYMDALASFASNIEEDHYGVWKDLKKDQESKISEIGQMILSSSIFSTTPTQLEEHLWKKDSSLPISFKHLLILVLAIKDKDMERAKDELMKAIETGATKDMILEALEAYLSIQETQNLESTLVKFQKVIEELFKS